MTYIDEHWGGVYDYLPYGPFWIANPERYAAIEKRMSLAVIVMEADLDFVLPMQPMSDDRIRQLLRKGKVL